MEQLCGKKHNAKAPCLVLELFPTNCHLHDCTGVFFLHARSQESRPPRKLALERHRDPEYNRQFDSRLADCTIEQAWAQHHASLQLAIGRTPAAMAIARPSTFGPPAAAVAAAAVKPPAPFYGQHRSTRAVGAAVGRAEECSESQHQAADPFSQQQSASDGSSRQTTQGRAAGTEQRSGQVPTGRAAAATPGAANQRRQLCT